MPTAARTDSNQNDIVTALRDLGATVNITSSLGDGFPDLVVSFQNRWFLIEIKDGSKTPSRQNLTSDEAAFHAKQRAPVYIADSPQDALLIVNNEVLRGNKMLEWKARQAKYIERGRK